MKILIIVDMQNDFVTGALGSIEALGTVLPICEKIQQANKNGDYVILTKDTHSPSYLNTLEGQKLPVPHCIRGTDGWNITPVLRHVVNECHGDRVEVIEKETFGAENLPEIIKDIMYDIGLERETDKKLDDYLNDMEIEVCGLCTDICVITNVALLRTAFPNTRIVVDSKSCAGTNPTAHEAALVVMRSIQVDVI